MKGRSARAIIVDLARRPLIRLLASRAPPEIWLLFRNAGHPLQPNQKRMKFADRCLDMIMLGGGGCVVSTERGAAVVQPTASSCNIVVTPSVHSSLLLLCAVYSQQSTALAQTARRQNTVRE